MASHVVCLGQHIIATTTTPYPTLNQPPWTPATLATSKTKKKQQHLPEQEEFKVTVPPLIPISGLCPGCKEPLVWGDLVRPLSVACASSRGSNRGMGVWQGPDIAAQVFDGQARNEELQSSAQEGSDDNHWFNMLTQK